MIGIYSILNLKNNKIYVGSSKSLQRRKYEHFYSLSKNTHYNNHLQNAYNKYGKNSFIFNILEECELSQLSNREEYWIKIYSSLDNNYGYNGCIVENSSHYYQQHTKDKMSLSNKSKKQVYQYDLQGNLLNRFDSIKKCSLVINIDRRAIQNSLNNTNQTARGFYFSFGSFDYINTNKFQHDKRISKYTLNDNYICSYNNIKQAAIDMNVAYTNLSRHLSQNKPKTIRGFKFKYQDTASSVSPHN
jgi:predicted GIY-YIG superfamily endonuclease